MGVGAYLRRHHLGLVAIFLALSGSAVAATVAKNSVTSKSIKDGQIRSADVEDNGLTGADVNEATLNGIQGQPGPQGERGEQGVPGAQGPAGPAGSPDTGGQILGKLASVDGPGSGLDADVLDGLSAGGFIQTGQSVGGTDLSGTYPNPTIAGGAVGPDELGPVPSARVWSSCPGPPATIVTGVETTLRFNVEEFDQGDLHTGTCDADSRLTAPRTGLYQVDAGVLWDSNPVGTRTLAITQDDTTYLAQDEDDANDSGATIQGVSTLTRLEEGGFVTVRVRQTSGGGLSVGGFDTRNYLAMAWLGP